MSTLQNLYYYDAGDGPKLLQYNGSYLGVLDGGGGTYETDPQVWNMTNDTTPSPLVATYSSRFNATYSGYRAFNGDWFNWPNDVWISGLTTAAWVGIDLGVGNEIYAWKFGLAINAISGGPDYAPKDFKFLGSNNGSDWDTLYEDAAEPAWSGDTIRTYEYAGVPDTAYRYYRYDCLECQTGPYVSIAEMFVYKFIP